MVHGNCILKLVKMQKKLFLRQFIFYATLFYQEKMEKNCEYNNAAFKSNQICKIAFKSFTLVMLAPLTLARERAALYAFMHTLTVNSNASVSSWNLFEWRKTRRNQQINGTPFKWLSNWFLHVGQFINFQTKTLFLVIQRNIFISLSPHF